MRTPRGGFTLIEMMTVTAVISLLVAMILPASEAVRESGRRAACAGQLRGVGVAMSQYAARHGCLPPYGSSQTNRTRNFYLATPPAEEDWTALWASGVLSNVQTLFCPSMRNAAHRFDTSQNPWPREMVRTCYSRRPLPQTAQGQRTHISQAREGQALAADLLVSPALLKYQHRDGVNVLYVGGAVEFRQDVAALFASAGVTGDKAVGNAQLDAVWAGLDHGSGP